MNHCEKASIRGESPLKTVAGDCETRTALVGRIVSSQSFQRAARLRELLLYIDAQAEDPEALSEQQIGIRVFGRKPSYNPGDDNIVRATARQLRIKLKEYFELEGAGEECLLEIPKGAYVPVLAMRPVPAPVVTRVLPAESVVAPVPEPARKNAPVPWAVAAVFFGLISAFLIFDKLRGPQVAPEPDSVLGEFLHQTQGQVRFVVTDSALAAMSLWRDQRVDLPKYTNGEFIREGADAFRDNGPMRFAWKDLGSRQITSLADLGVLVRLLQIYPSGAHRIEVQHARQMPARGFKKGNLILMGSAWANPWSTLFETNLNFRFEPHRIVNRSPLAGEPVEFSDAGNATGEQWSRIALMRNLSGSDWVLLIAGLKFEGTEGAGEYLLHPASAVEIRRLLKIGQGEPLPPFELLLSTKSLGGTAYESRIVCWRRH